MNNIYISILLFFSFSCITRNSTTVKCQDGSKGAEYYCSSSMDSVTVKNTKSIFRTKMEEFGYFQIFLVIKVESVKKKNKIKTITTKYSSDNYVIYKESYYNGVTKKY